MFMGGLMPFEVALGVTGIFSFLPTLMVSNRLRVASDMALEKQSYDRDRARMELIRSELNGHYGLELSSEDLKALSYPGAQPTSDFSVFGSIVRQERSSENSFVERKIYLVWMNERMQLCKSKDGKTFKELKPARRAIEAQSQSTPAALTTAGPQK